MTTIKIKKLNEKAIIPTHGSESAAGYDLYACIDAPICIPAGESYLIPTGLAMEIPCDYWGGVYARSGLANEHYLRPGNCVGVIDSDYRGEVKVCLHSDNQFTEKVVEPGQRIAQFILHKREEINFDLEDEISETNRGEGGFGSTGK